jgi:uncharacterized protein (DUF302 family)
VAEVYGVRTPASIERDTSMGGAGEPVYTNEKEGAMKRVGIAVLLAMVAVNAFAGGNGLISKPSRYSARETMDRLAAVLQSKGMTVFARIDHAAEAEKIGIKMRPSQLLVFGNPKGGTPLMAAAPTVAIDLPLKALAWEDAGGKVWLGYNSPSYLKERHGIEGMDEALKALAGVLDAMTDKALE